MESIFPSVVPFWVKEEGRTAEASAFFPLRFVEDVSQKQKKENSRVKVKNYTPVAWSEGQGHEQNLLE